ncbi:MAG: carboxypeptidase regulatory-like domain-containing protein [Polyangiaceae bacterium]
MSLSETLTRFLALGLVSTTGLLGCASDTGGKSSGRTGGAGGASTGTATTGSPTGTGGNTGGTGGGIGTGGSGGSGIGTSDAATGGFNCKNLVCFQNSCKGGGCIEKECTNGSTTSISGVVYDPAGINPLYNVIVYVPNSKTEPIPTGATCDACGKASGEPITSTLTNAKGEFKLDNVPIADNVPIVIQVGKWRRQFTIPKPAACQDTRLSDRNQTRMPRNKSEGDIPRIALTTGNADALECLLRKIGISESEMTPETGAGRINFYAGDKGAPKYNGTLNGGAPFTPAPTFWSNANSLKGYDIVLLSCEGIEVSTNKSQQALNAMLEYVNAGGRVFASHWHNYWLEKGPAPLPTVATFEHHPDLPNPFTTNIDMSFPKGKAMAEWLVNVGSAAPLGQLIITEGKHTVNRESQTPGVSQRWVFSTSPVSVQYLSFNTPVGVEEEKQCGRMVFSDIHVSAQDESTPTTAYPDGCKTTSMTDQEKALEFMLFDLSACVIKDTKPPIPPK